MKMAVREVTFWREMVDSEVRIVRSSGSRVSGAGLGRREVLSDWRRP